MTAPLPPSVLQFTDWLSMMGRTYQRANKLQAHLCRLATVAANEGLHAQARSLYAISDRALIVADQYVEEMFKRVP